ncbi:ORF66 [Retroperitoneal fibromatosis-associated herpesvirus]|uniref:ORF66 n=1 Tax=Retroperitoneal fibromatosis-associated herpesvirus TaxID=111469 RepID=U5NM44_9GAMA|nr:ORF66 [Retroperitoneal fibromatosis-associated herpesvirus]AGY30752.1 ORF66 [Retroperitoneal fibromatosis-associated herpesvirus]
MALVKRWTDFTVAWLRLDPSHLTSYGVFEGDSGAPPEEYLGFLVFGSPKDRYAAPWARCLLERPSLGQAIVCLLGREDDVPAKTALLYSGQRLLSAYVWVAMTLAARCPTNEATRLRLPPRYVWLKYLSMPFVKACAQLSRFVGLSVRFPFVTCVPREPLTLPWMRKRWHGTSLQRGGLEVPAPSARGTVVSTPAGAADVGLTEALRRVAETVPCGRPFDAMLLALGFACLAHTPRVVLPVTESGAQDISLSLCKRLLAYNVLFPCVSLPMVSDSVAAAARAKLPTCARAVVCLECGHCLNFGRGRFHTVNFPPTNVFFSRDQKEKQFSVCGTTGRVYCSYCGSEHMRAFPLCELAGTAGDARVLLRAVLANNAALAISDLEQNISFAVPCLGAPECEAALLKHATVRGILYLASALSEFLCAKCAR